MSGLPGTLFSSDGFLPHGHCFAWTASLLWTYVLSDGVIALSYFSIPAALWVFLGRRRDIPFNGIFLMFAIFIFACGTTHLMAIVDIWQPVYWLDATVKAGTAAASLATAIMLWPQLPRALALPSPNALLQANARLQAEIARRVQVEDELHGLNRRLEERVAARTAELEAANQALRDRFDAGQLAAGALEAKEEQLRAGEQRLREVVESVLHGLVVVDHEGRIELVNRQLELMFGYPRAQLVGRTIDQLVPQRYRSHHGNLIAHFFSAPSRREMAGRMELFALARDGTEIPVEIGLNPISAGRQLRVLATITDLSAPRAARLQLESALAEKTALLKEVHHRVKNNLQVIISLLKMQARSASAEVGEVLTESCSRVLAMATIHQLLYEHGDLSRIQLGAYLQQLLGLLRDSYAERRGFVNLVLKNGAQDCHLDIQRAISCGLIVNELVTNAYKHAFPQQRRGIIVVELACTADGLITIAVSDDGVGMPATATLGQGRSLGLRLLPILTDQLGGKLTLVREPGARYELRFRS